MIWTIYRVEHIGTHQRISRVGNVRARHQPHALIRAFTRWNIWTNDEQRQLMARPKGWALHKTYPAET